MSASPLGPQAKPRSLIPTKPLLLLGIYTLRLGSLSANVQDRLAELKSVTESLKKSGYDSISLYGFCWGGKVSAVASQYADLFKSVAIVHPAMLDAADVENLQVPFGFYPSKVCELLRPRFVGYFNIGWTYWF